LAAKARGNVITLDDSTYEYFAVNSPRPYSLVVFFTASHAKFKCTICKSLDSSLQSVASAYKKSHGYGSSSPTEGSQNEVFFLRLDYEASQRVFGKYDVTGVPLVFHIGPDFGSSGEDADMDASMDGDDEDEQDKSSSKGGSNNKYHITHREKFQAPGVIDADSLIDFLRDRTGYSVTVERSMFMSYVLLTSFFGFILFLIPYIMRSLDNFWLPFVRSKSLWAFVSASVYTCAISGLIFDIIRSPPMYYANPQNGQLMFFYPQSGNQFVVEGFVIGFLNLGCALSLVFLGIIAPKFKSEESRSVAVIGGLLSFIICFWQIRNLYKMKNRWYGGY
jgi:hypothetical protein